MIEVFCGTGGVGKTTLSAARALEQSKNKKTVLLTIDPSERLKSLFNIQYFSQEPKSDPNNPNLFVFSFQKKSTFDRLVLKHSQSLYNKISSSPLYEVMVESLPKLHEYMAIQEIADIISHIKPEVFIIDTPPGQHFVDFLSSSEKLLNFFNERTEKIIHILSGKRFSFMAFAIKKAMNSFEHLVGGSFIENLFTFLESLSELKDQVKIDHENIQSIFKDKNRSRIFLITSSEEILESNMELLMKDVHSYKIDKVIVNRDWSHIPTKKYQELQNRIIHKQNQVLKKFSKCFINDFAKSPQTVEELAKLGAIIHEQILK